MNWELQFNVYYFSKVELFLEKSFHWNSKNQVFMFSNKTYSRWKLIMIWDGANIFQILTLFILMTITTLMLVTGELYFLLIKDVTNDKLQSLSKSIFLFKSTLSVINLSLKLSSILHRNLLKQTVTLICFFNYNQTSF